MKKWILFLALLFTLSSIPAFSATTPRAGSVCSKQGMTKNYKGKIFSCIKSGKKLVWSKGSKLSSSTTLPLQISEIPIVGTACPQVGLKVFVANGYIKCHWIGGLRGEISQQIFWRFFPITKISTSKSNKYKTIPRENEVCSNSGDTFDIEGGYLECRWVSGKKLIWIKLNSIKKTFINAKSPMSIETCKLQNSASTANRSGRNFGAGLVGFPFINTDKNGINIKGSNEVLIVPIDFPDFPGNNDLKKKLEYDIKWMVDWYRYFSSGKTQFNITTFDQWLRMPKPRSSYPTDAKGDYSDSNYAQGRQGQAFIDEITKEIDLRKFSTVYVFYPDGEFTLNDLIVRNHRFNIKEGEKNLNFFSWGKNLEAMENAKWPFYIHETLHDLNVLGHAPGNGWPFGIMTNQSGPGLALNPYEQFLMDWLPADQIYCDDTSTLRSGLVSLSPVEREDNQTKMVIIRLSATKAIVVLSHGRDKWSSFNFGDREFPPGFYSIMAFVVDLDKAEAPPINFDGTSRNNEDWAWAVWQKVDGGKSTQYPNFPAAFGADIYSATAVLGDSFLIEGVRIKFVSTGDYETIQITKE